MLVENAARWRDSKPFLFRRELNNMWRAILRPQSAPLKISSNSTLATTISSKRLQVKAG
jgi:hypothetical protein